jgi:hypothetical protein
VIDYQHLTKLVRALDGIESTPEQTKEALLSGFQKIRQEFLIRHQQILPEGDDELSTFVKCVNAGMHIEYQLGPPPNRVRIKPDDRDVFQFVTFMITDWPDDSWKADIETIRGVLIEGAYDLDDSGKLSTLLESGRYDKFIIERLKKNEEIKKALDQKP